jgi:hypothetical protein
MSDPILELLRELRADAPEPDADQWARAFRRAVVARPRAARRRRAALVIAAAVVAAAAAGVLLAAPWQSGPGEAHAATIVRRVLAAVAPQPHTIFHERYRVTGVPFAGAGRTVTIANELWRESGGTGYRMVDESLVPSVPIERATAPGGGSLVYDPRAGAIYRLPPATALLPVGPSSSAGGLGNVTATLRDDLAGGGLADGWTVTRTALAGRDVYRISNMLDSPAGPTGTTLYVDAATYVPVRIEEPGLPKDEPGGPRTRPGGSYSVGPRTPRSLTVTDILTYETLEATAANLALLDLTSAHPGARELPSTELPSDLQPRVVTVSTAPSTPGPGSTDRLLVNPEQGSVGGFRIGDPLLRVAPLLPKPIADFPLQPGNLRAAAAVGTLDASGTFVVAFRDAAEEHSVAAYLTRLFRTARGDVNGPDGTTLEAFLAHWPDHGEPATNASGVTTVAVGRAAFSFAADGRLAAVTLGDSRALPFRG